MASQHRAGHLGDPPYTGYAFFGRWTRQQTLLDPDDVAAGTITRFRRSRPGRIVRSCIPAHPAIISVEDFTRAQLRRKSRASAGMRSIANLDRSHRAGTRSYLPRGLVRCGLCGRRMHGGARKAAKERLSRAQTQLRLLDLVHALPDGETGPRAA